MEMAHGGGISLEFCRFLMSNMREREKEEENKREKRNEEEEEESK